MKITHALYSVASELVTTEDIIVSEWKSTSHSSNAAHVKNFSFSNILVERNYFLVLKHSWKS
jgi:hypothetical protein